MVIYFEFKSNNNIIIDKDNGRAIVTVDSKHDLKMINNHLNQKTNYKNADSNFDKKIKGVTQVLEKYKENKRRQLSHRFFIQDKQFL